MFHRGASYRSSVVRFRPEHDDDSITSARRWESGSNLVGRHYSPFDTISDTPRVRNQLPSAAKKSQNRVVFPTTNPRDGLVQPKERYGDMTKIPILRLPAEAAVALSIDTWRLTARRPVQTSAHERLPKRQVFDPVKPSRSFSKAFEALPRSGGSHDLQCRGPNYGAGHFRSPVSSPVSNNSAMDG